MPRMSSTASMTLDRALLEMLQCFAERMTAQVGGVCDGPWLCIREASFDVVEILVHKDSWGYYCVRKYNTYILYTGINTTCTVCARISSGMYSY